jgi:ABC-type nitrate/sulfonate/bicarbonate transport system ATPase subunit
VGHFRYATSAHASVGQPACGGFSSDVASSWVLNCSAFAVKPDLLVLDEPFVSLDAKLALRLRAELAELVSRRPVTTLLVTHSIEEAVGLADRIILLTPSPARVLADVPIDAPRRVRSPERIAALSREIGQKFDVPVGN